VARAPSKPGGMGNRLEHIRLTIRDVEDLTTCLTRLDEVHDSINATNLSGRLALMGACVQVYRVIERLLKREQAAVQHWAAKLQSTSADTASEENA
jgi:hypothetical protein